MTLYCDFCGRRWFAHWPEFWPYRYKDEIYCSENCRICSATLIKLGKGEKKLMTRMKKDGTPAKRPGPKAGRKPNKIEIPEPVAGGKWEKMETPEDVPEVKLTGPIRIETPEAKNVKVVEVPERSAKKPIEYKVTGIQTEVGEFWVVREGKIKWVPGRLAKEDPVMQVMWPEAEPALVPEMWRRFAEIILYVIDLLEVES